MRTYLISDVDGVINCETKGSSDWLNEWGWGLTHGSAEALITNEVDGVKTIPLRWSPLLTYRMNRLANREDVEAMWLTTWCDLATTRLPQITGLDCSRWPVLGEAEFNENREGGEWWKLTAIRAWYEYRSGLDDDFRFVWIDDQLRRHGGLLWTADLPKGRCLPIIPVSRCGISPNEMTTIERFAQ